MKRFIHVCLVIFPVASTDAQPGNIKFIENKGHGDRRVGFRGNVPEGSFFVRDGGGLTVLPHNIDDLLQLQASMHGQKANGETRNITDKITLQSHSFNVDFIGASASSEIITEKPLDTYNNYFIGNDSSRWASRCKVNQGITVENTVRPFDIGIKKLSPDGRSRTTGMDVSAYTPDVQFFDATKTTRKGDITLIR